MADLVERFVRNHKLKDREEYRELLKRTETPEIMEYLKEQANILRNQFYGKKVYVRGLIEFTNYCKNSCYYCGINNNNRKAVRYRLTPSNILECCDNGWRLGIRTFVLQGGEDPWYTETRIVELIHAIKSAWPKCALTLSVGEWPYESYQIFKEAGADRYLLRHETANEAHYRSLHPSDMSLSERKQCLYNLKNLGFQTGAGFMIGSPGQTYMELSEDLIFLQELQPEMVGIGPFIPHKDTKFSFENSGSVELTLRMLSIVRILLPAALIPATTALGTLALNGREKGLEFGANVVMPNLSPKKIRKQYALYNNKLCEDEEAVEGLDALARCVEGIGYELCMERGDVVRYV